MAREVRDCLHTRTPQEKQEQREKVADTGRREQRKKIDKATLVFFFVVVTTRSEKEKERAVLTNTSTNKEGQKKGEKGLVGRRWVYGPKAAGIVGANGLVHLVQLVRIKTEFAQVRVGQRSDGVRHVQAWVSGVGEEAQ